MVRFLLLISALLTITFTTIVSIPGSPYLIGGMTQADISNMFSTSVTPAGFTFAIWSLIYLSWIVAGIYVAFFQKWKKKIETTLLITFSLAIALTAVWLIPWGNIWIGTALLLMFIILWLLIFAFSRSRDTHILLQSSIHITLWWITMATALNITVWIRFLGIDLGAPWDLYYAIFALGSLLLIVSSLQCRYKTYIVSGVFLWTLLGVWIAHPIHEEQVAVGIFALVTIFNMAYSYTKK